jgi:hypothetical protein
VGLLETVSPSSHNRSEKLGCLRQQPKRIHQAFILRCPFERTFGGIGTCSGDPINIGAAGDQANDMLPFLASRKRLEVNVAHRLPLEVRRSAPAKQRFRARQDRHNAALRKGICTMLAAAARCGTAHSVASQRRRGMLAEKKATGRDFRET